MTSNWEIDEFETFHLWVEQGCPTDRPVIVRRGLLVVDGDRRFITDWSWDSLFQKSPATDLDVWTWLAERYPESLVLL